MLRSYMQRYLGSGLPALLLLLAVGCDRAVNIKNASSKNASVYVSIPESAGRSLVRVDAGATDASELGDSGVYTVYVMADDTVVSALTKVRDDLEAQLQNTTSAAQVQDLTAKLQASSTFLTQLTNRSTSCGGKVAEGDAYVNIGWDAANNVFTAQCISKSSANGP